MSDLTTVEFRRYQPHGNQHSVFKIVEAADVEIVDNLTVEFDPRRIAVLVMLEIIPVLDPYLQLG